MSLLSLKKSTVLVSQLIYLVVVWLFLLVSDLSHASEWSVKGNVNQSLGYDDNVRMNPDAPQGSFEYKIIPTIKFQHKTDALEISGDASYGTQIYTDVAGFDQDIQAYGLDGLYKTERINWGLGFNYSVIPTRNTATFNSGDFGTISSNTTWSLSPFMSYKISEIDSIVITPGYQERAFDNSNATSFRNSNTKSINLAWQRAWNERYNSSVSLSYSNFESQRGSVIGTIPSSFDTTGINFSNNYHWSENWTIMGTIGVRHTESNNQIGKSSSFGFLANAGVNYASENYNTGLTFSRSLIPSSFGQLQEQTGVDFNFTYNVNERLSTSFDTSYLNSTLVNEISSTRDNILVQPAVNWAISPDWKLAGSYRFRTQELSANGNAASADSNMFMLTINYNWPGLSLSK